MPVYSDDSRLAAWASCIFSKPVAFSALWYHDIKVTSVKLGHERSPESSAHMGMTSRLCQLTAIILNPAHSNRKQCYCLVRIVLHYFLINQP